jgi:hypothetical protein
MLEGPARDLIRGQIYRARGRRRDDLNAEGASNARELGVEPAAMGGVRHPQQVDQRPFHRLAHRLNSIAAQISLC